MLVDYHLYQLYAIFQANQAAAKQQQAAAAAAQPEPITFDISITVPLKYTPGTDINIAAREFCDRHGLDPTATVPVRSKICFTYAISSVHTAVTNGNMIAAYDLISACKCPHFL